MSVQETIELEAVSSILLEPQATLPQIPLRKAGPGELGHDHDADARWRLAKRVVASRHFARSPLLSKFLLFVVTETLEGRQQEITEHQIGVQVFGRPTSYRTVEDNIVRNYARQLRKRLAEHFADVGSREAMQIEIPVGGYVPVFEKRAEQSAMGLEFSQQMHEEPQSLETPETRKTDNGESVHPVDRRPGVEWMWMAAGLILGLSLASALWLWAGTERSRAPCRTRGPNDQAAGHRRS